MTVATATTDREQALLRSLRPPELREAPDEWYAAVVRQANRIAQTDAAIRRVRYSIRRARVGLAEDTWPNVRQAYYNFEKHRYDGTELRFDPDDIVTLAWLIDIRAGEGGVANLHELHRVASNYHRASDPYKRGAWWGPVYTWGMNGSLRSMSRAGLVQHVAPLTWRLTEPGRELVAVVFGGE